MHSVHLWHSMHFDVAFCYDHLKSDVSHMIWHELFDFFKVEQIVVLVADRREMTNTVFDLAGHECAPSKDRYCSI